MSRTWGGIVIEGSGRAKRVALRVKQGCEPEKEIRKCQYEKA